MSRRFIINTEAQRSYVIECIRKAALGFRIEAKRNTRTLPQNDRMWAMLGDVAGQATYHGLKLTSEDWKLIFMDGLGHEMRLVPNLAGTGFVNLGRSSSKLSVEEMTALMDLIEAYAAQHSIKLYSKDKDNGIS